MEYRRDHRKIIQMTGAVPGIVGEQHIAGLKCVNRKSLKKETHTGGHRVDVARCTGYGLREHSAAIIENTR